LYTTYHAGNHLLDSLSSADRSDLANDLEIVALPSRRSIQPYGGPRHHVDFPMDAVISIVATMRNGDAVEVGTVGCEGFMETDAALESDIARRGSFCQISGTVARMTLSRFRERMVDSPPFARLMRRSVTAALFNAQQIAACNAKHRIEAQCARWLLMTRDRVGRDTFPVTHESLALLLGVRRASITVAAQSLQASGAIAHHRGLVTITDADTLAAASCECYDDCTEAFELVLQDPDHASVYA
jgi:hypothetical protein